MSRNVKEHPIGRWSTLSIGRGVLAGLGGGVMFGLVMAVVGMLPMVGMLIRQNNALIGFLVHMVISAIIGAGFGMIMWFMTSGRPGTTLLLGALYGVFWWVLGGLVLMPLLLGMPQMILSVGDMQGYSLLGHVLYGLTVGIVMNALSGSQPLNK